MEQKKKKICIAGKVSGLEIAEYTANFHIAEEFLLSKGYEVINPIEHCDIEMEWSDCMINCLKLLSGCDGIYILNNWSTSIGARIEQLFSCRMRDINPSFEIMYESDFDIYY